MYKYTATYTGYDGVERTEDFLFNLSEAEIVEMEYGVTGGMKRMLEQIVAAKDTKRIMDVFKDLIKRAYGVKSPDGRRFEKDEKLSKEFTETPVYSDMFMKFARDADAAAEFVNKIIPQSVAAEVAKQG